jgi:hypothetical protein
MTRARRARQRAADVSDYAWARLTDQPLPPAIGFERFILDRTGDGPGTLRALWAAHGDAITDAWAHEQPGTRPSCWWRWSAPRAPLGTWPDCYYDGQLPAPRQRVGGIGTPRHEALAYVPDFCRGVPTAWVSQRDADHYNGRARDVHGAKVGDGAEGDFRGVSVSASDPPRYEAEAGYLERFGLLLPGERERLTDDDFSPVLLAIGEGACG